MGLKKIALLVVLVVGVVMINGCISDRVETQTTSINVPSTSTVPRLIDINCTLDLEYKKEKYSKDGFGCSGNSVYCADCEYFYPSFVLTHQYNLTEIEFKARQKGYLTEWNGGFATKLAIIKKISENESYWIGIKEDRETGVGGRDVIAYQNGECCLDKEYVRNQFKYILDDLGLEYSGLNESKIERGYVVKMTA